MEPGRTCLTGARLTLAKIACSRLLLISLSEPPSLPLSLRMQIENRKKKREEAGMVGGRCVALQTAVIHWALILHHE